MPTLEKFIVPIGPQHPALKEPGHFEFTVDGETVTSASGAPGLRASRHREGHRRVATGRRTCICWSASAASARTRTRCAIRWAWKRWPKSPRRRARRRFARWWPSWNACTVICCGWAWPRTKPASIRCSCTAGAIAKRSWTCWKRLTGNRVNYSANVLGGVKFDVDEKQIDAIQRGVDYLEERTHHYLQGRHHRQHLHAPHARRGHADDGASGGHRRHRADGARVGHRARCARRCAVCRLQRCSRSTSWSKRPAIWKRASWCA